MSTDNELGWLGGAKRLILVIYPIGVSVNIHIAAGCIDSGFASYEIVAGCIDSGFANYQIAAGCIDSGLANSHLAAYRGLLVGIHPGCQSFVLRVQLHRQC